MTRIIAYTFDADYYCPDCTRIRFPAPHGLTSRRVEVDEHGVHTRAGDSMGNLVHPVFNTDELPTELEDRHGGVSSLHCGYCKCLIANRDRSLENEKPHD